MSLTAIHPSFGSHLRTIRYAYRSLDPSKTPGDMPPADNTRLFGTAFPDQSVPSEMFSTTPPQPPVKPPDDPFDLAFQWWTSDPPTPAAHGDSTVIPGFTVPNQDVQFTAWYVPRNNGRGGGGDPSVTVVAIDARESAVIQDQNPPGQPVTCILSVTPASAIGTGVHNKRIITTDAVTLNFQPHLDVWRLVGFGHLKWCFKMRLQFQGCTSSLPSHTSPNGHTIKKGAGGYVGAVYGEGKVIVPPIPINIHLPGTPGEVHPGEPGEEFLRSLVNSGVSVSAGELEKLKGEAVASLESSIKQLRS